MVTLQIRKLVHDYYRKSDGRYFPRFYVYMGGAKYPKISQKEAAGFFYSMWKLKFEIIKYLRKIGKVEPGDYFYMLIGGPQTKEIARRNSGKISITPEDIDRFRRETGSL